MGLLPILYPSTRQVCRRVHCMWWPYLWVLQDADGRKVFCQAWRQGKKLWAESLNALYRCTQTAHVSLPCCSNGKLLRPSYPQSISATTASVIGPRCSCPGLGCFQSSSTPGGLLGWQSYWHSHTSWRRFQGGHGCRYWTARTDPWETPSLGMVPPLQNCSFLWKLFLT